MTLKPLNSVPLRGLIAALLLLGAPAQAQSPILRAEILPGWQASGGQRMAALHVQMQPGWHTYWRIPGEAGIAPVFDWSASQNLDSVQLIWPAPEVFSQNGYVSYGYEDVLILPMQITPRDPSRPVALIGSLALGVCRDTCVPADVSVSGALRGSGGPDARISDALERRAEPAERAGLSAATCRLEPATRGAELTLRATLPHLGGDEHLILELPGTGLRVSDQRSWREGDQLVARARVRAAGGAAVSIDRAELAFTILGDDRMISARGCTGEN